MGFLKDIEDMPNQYEYSLKFFARFYRPEHTTILLAGDVKHDQALSLVKKYWSGWKRGDYDAQVPQESKRTGPRTAEITWPSETLPWILIAHAGPAFSDEAKDMPAADLISSLAFSENSDLYQKLVIREQKVDAILPMFEDHKDPYLLAVAARVKNPADIGYVQDEILKAIEAIKARPVQKERLENVKSNLKYSLALRMDSSEAIAEILSHYIQLRRTPEALNRVYQVYDTITSEDIMQIASRYFVPEGRTIVTLRSGGKSER
jgi:zinc protease